MKPLLEIVTKALDALNEKMLSIGFVKRVHNSWPVEGLTVEQLIAKIESESIPRDAVFTVDGVGDSDAEACLEAWEECPYDLEEYFSKNAASEVRYALKENGYKVTTKYFVLDEYVTYKDYLDGNLGALIEKINQLNTEV